eukprot:11210500-Karenia_brevis.AAC.1
MQIISAHAPCEHAAYGVKDKFWRSLTSLSMRLKNQTPSALMWLAIDGNARVGPDVDGACGSVEADEVSEN